jgi:hypothetical protein
MLMVPAALPGLAGMKKTTASTRLWQTFGWTMRSTPRLLMPGRCTFIRFLPAATVGSSSHGPHRDVVVVVAIVVVPSLESPSSVGRYIFDGRHCKMHTSAPNVAELQGHIVT